MMYTRAPHLDKKDCQMLRSLCAQIRFPKIASHSDRSELTALAAPLNLRLTHKITFPLKIDAILSKPIRISDSTVCSTYLPRTAFLQ